MRRRFLRALGVGTLALLCNPQSALAGILFHRRRNVATCEAPRAAPAPGMTVEELATLLVTLKGQINDAIPDVGIRSQLDRVLQSIMGDPNTIFSALGQQVANQERVSVAQVRTFFGGEVLDLSDELRRLRNR